MGNPFETLVLALAGCPSLPGARCRNRSALFDGAGQGEHPDLLADRHAQAAGLCAHCPALHGCRAWIDGLPRTRRPEGVVAGRIPAKRGRRANDKCGSGSGT